MSISKQDIITSIKNSDIFLKISELEGAKPKINSNGTPFAFVGGFNMVFQLEHKNKKWALRVWHVPIGEHSDRYREISKYISEKKLPYFADFIYDQKGILVNGTYLDTIRMEWLEGKLLKEFIEENLKNKNQLTLLANNFLIMCEILRKNKISHGDLQEGNILIEKNGNIKLIDYDSICTPEIEGQKELVTGLKGYQHPSRFKAGKTSLKADFFSELVIYISILALAENNELWNKYEVKQTNYLLFTENDFVDLENSEIFKDLQILSNSIKSLLRVLLGYLKERNYLNLISFENYLTKPKLNKYEASRNEILYGKSVDLIWDIENIDNIVFNNGIGDVTNKKSLNISPTQTTTYKLTAKNAFGKVEEELTIEVLPLPDIKFFKSSRTKIKKGEKVKFNWNIENVHLVEIKNNKNYTKVEFKDDIELSPIENFTFELKITALDKKTTEIKTLDIQVFDKVNIENFQTDLNFVLETLPVKITWKVINNSNLELITNGNEKIDVTGKNEIELFPKIKSVYELVAKNDLFQIKSDKIIVDVQKLPIMPKINSFIQNGNRIIPQLNFDFKQLELDIIQSTAIEFENIMKSKKKVGLFSSLKSILNLKK